MSSDDKSIKSTSSKSVKDSDIKDVKNTKIVKEKTKLNFKKLLNKRSLISVYC